MANNPYRRAPVPSQQPSKRETYAPLYPGVDLVNSELQRPHPPGSPPIAKPYAVTTFDGRQNLMRDFYYKIPFGGFMNAPLGSALPGAAGAPVVVASTESLYPLTLADGFSDIGPNAFADATPNGAGAIIAEATFPSGSGYNSPGPLQDTRLTFDTGIFGDPEIGDWTLEMWVRVIDGQTGSGRTIFTANGSSGTNNIRLSVSNNVPDRFQFTVSDDASVDYTLTSETAAADLTTHFLSLTKRGERLFMHVDGVMEATIAVNPGANFNFNAATPEAFNNTGGTASAVVGLLGDMRFTNAALYGGGGYAVPVEALAVQSNSVNLSAFAMVVPDGYAMILRQVVFAGGLYFNSTVSGGKAAKTSATGPSDDFFSTSRVAPIITLSKNGNALRDISFGNTPGLSDDSTIGELIYGPLAIDLYEILDQGDIFSAAQSVNPLWDASFPLIAMNETTFCYLYGQIVPRRNGDINEAGLTYKPVFTKELEDREL